MRAGRGLGIAAIVFTCAASARGAPPPRMEDVARDVIAAAARGDVAAVARAAHARAPEPFLVVGELRRVALEGTDAEAVPAMTALEAFVAAASTGPSAEGLGRLGDRWRRSTASERAVERTRSRLRDTVRAMNAAGRPAEVLAAIDAGRAALDDPTDYWVLRVRGFEAMALGQLGKSPEDEEAWRAVGRDAASLGWHELVGIAFSEAGMLAAERFDEELAATDRATAADRYERIGDEESAAGIRVTLARSLARLGRTAEAVAALARAEANGALDPVGRAQATWVRALVTRTQGRLAESLAMQESAATSLAVAGDRGLAAAAFADLAHVLHAEGRPADAIATLDRALGFLDGPGASIATGRSLVESEFATLLLSLRRFPEALAHADAGLAFALESGRPALVRASRSDRAIVLSEMGRLREALDEQSALRSLWVAARNRHNAAGVRLNESSTLWKMKRLPEAERASVEARDEAIALGDRRLEALARSGHGLVVYSLGDIPRALEIQRDAVALFDALGDRARPAASANRIFSVLLGRSGAYGEALDAARRTLRIQRSLLEGLAEGDGTEARGDLRRTCDLGVFTALEYMRRRPEHAPEAALAAFEFAEAGRALALTQGLANPAHLLAATLPPDLVKADADSRRTLVGARQRYEAALKRAPDDDDVRAATREMDLAWTSRDEMVLRIERASRRASSFVAPPAPDLAALRAAIAPDTALVLYHVSFEVAAAVVVRTSGVELVDLGSVVDLKEASSAWLRVASTPGAEDAKAGAALAAQILRPMRARLEGVTHLVISPDEPLSFVPFEALPLKTGDRVGRLIERFDVTYVPSAAVWSALRAEAPLASAAILAIGNPSTSTTGIGEERGLGLRSLPGGEEEARAVAAFAPVDARALLLGGAATLDAVTRALDAPQAAFRAIHFACHAIVDPSRPRATGLVLAGGDLLDVDRIAGSRWRADLAVVAACESAQGRFSSGEGVLGIPRALFLAGVPRAIVSQWVVSDRATAPFMKRFYEEVLGKRLSTAAALREAKLAALREGGPGAHPSAWAPFVLWGRSD